MTGEPITYFDRYARAMRRDSHRWLFFARPFFSTLFGWWMKRPASRARIGPFIEKYGLDTSEFLHGPESFASFNDFFCRRLKPEARPVETDPSAVVFPADGRHLGWPVLGTEQGVFVKGQRWDLEQLLGGDTSLVKIFEGGSLVLSRLCPVDYHHFHFPLGGRLVESRWMGSRLYSVSPIALRQRLSCLWENKRHLSLLSSERHGRVCFIVVGATNVGSIRYHARKQDQSFQRGDPFGWFEFGGSSVITVFEPGQGQLSEDLVELTHNGTELYARVGDRMGNSCSN